MGVRKGIEIYRTRIQAGPSARDIMIYISEVRSEVTIQHIAAGEQTYPALVKAGWPRRQKISPKASADFTHYLISILLSLAVGLVGFVAAYKLFDWLTPGVLFSDQLNADNRAVGIFLAGLFVGLG